MLQAVMSVRRDVTSLTANKSTAVLELRLAVPDEIDASTFRASLHTWQGRHNDFTGKTIATEQLRPSRDRVR